MAGTLYVISTPIGNLEDITLRALRVLKEVDLIAAEDTRHSRKLLTHFGITKPLISYWREKEKVRSKEVRDAIHSGRSVALICDAGTPGIADPGEVLIQEALSEGIEVIPVPGVTSVACAVSVCGLSTKRFCFIGFLSHRHVQRKKELMELKEEGKTLIFFESPHRLVDFLQDIHEVFGNRRLALCHELTKYYEEVMRATVAEVLRGLKERKIAGEYVIVVEGAPDSTVSLDDGVKEVTGLMSRGLARKEAVAQVADAAGLSRKVLYKESLLKEREEVVDEE